MVKSETMILALQSLLFTTKTWKGKLDSHQIVTHRWRKVKGQGGWGSSQGGKWPATVLGEDKEACGCPGAEPSAGGNHRAEVWRVLTH